MKSIKASIYKSLLLLALAGISVISSGCGYERIAAPIGETGEFISGPQDEFDAFCRSVFSEELSDSGTLDLHYTILDPDAYGVDQKAPSLGSFSLSDMAAEIASDKALKSRLSAFDRSLLSDSQTLVLDTLSETLDVSLSAEGLALYAQPLAPTIGIQAQLPILFAEYSFQSIQDVQDYLALLSQIDIYYRQILDFERQKADAGLGPSDPSIDRILSSCRSYLIDPEDNFLTETFETRLQKLSRHKDLTETQKAAFRSQHTDAIRSHFIPAYELLIEGMSALKGKGRNTGGLAGFRDGKKYYEYLVKSGPGLSLSVSELQHALSGQMQKDYEAIQTLLASGFSPGSEYVGTARENPEEILSRLKSQISQDFPTLPECDYEIHFVPSHLESSLSPAFYLTAPIDEVNQNVIYINNSYSGQGSSLYATLAHEGFPGHLYQTVYSRIHAPDPLLALLSCSGACEGWATYVETLPCSFPGTLSKAAGEYAARLRSFSLCAHGLLDIGINYLGWTWEQAKAFITSCFQVDDDTVTELWQTMIDNPANYLEYCGGYVEIMQMREQAELSLGNRFSPLEFHRFLLDLGPVPFPVIRDRFSLWLSDQTS